MNWYNGFWVFHSFSSDETKMGYFWKSMLDQTEHGPFETHDLAYDAGRSDTQKLRTNQ